MRHPLTNSTFLATLVAIVGHPQLVERRHGMRITRQSCVRAGKMVLITLVANLSALTHTAVAQNPVPPHRSKIGVLGWRGSTLYVVELGYPSPGNGSWYTLSFEPPLPFLKAGQTYGADVLGTSADPRQRIINFDYGGAHFGEYAFWGTGVFYSCKSSHALLWALKNGEGDCTAADEAKDPIQWKDADAVSSLSPREQFELYANAYTYTWRGESDRDPLDPDHYQGMGWSKTAVERIDQDREAFLNKLGQLLPLLNPPPEIPEDARKDFIEGTTLVKNASNGNDLFNADNKFSDAEIKAPWWADAFYNQAQVLRRENLFDQANEALKEYTLLNPSASASRETKDLGYTIDAEKEMLERRQQEYISTEAVRYVSGGAQRVKEDDAPKEWKTENGCGVECLYAYRPRLADLDRHYGNIFLMPDGHYLGILLVGAADNSGEFSGDRVLIVDITSGHVKAFECAFGALNERFQPGTGATYTVSVSERSATGVINVTEVGSGAGIAMPLADLYSARYDNAVSNSSSSPRIGNTIYTLALEGGSRSVSALLFDDKFVTIQVDPLSLTPSYVLAMDHGDHPVGSTGYFIRWHGDTWAIAKN